MRASKQSREKRSGLRNLLRCDEAQGNPARLSDFGSTANVNLLGSSPGSPKKDVVFFGGGFGGAVERSETEGVALL